MEKQNCWEFKKCGRQPGGENVSQDGVCPASIFEDADGFCGGKNGGRSCVYITGTLCSKDICAIKDLSEKAKHCAECEFYKTLKNDHGNEISLIAFRDYVEKKRSASKEPVEVKKEETIDNQE